MHVKISNEIEDQSNIESTLQQAQLSYLSCFTYSFPEDINPKLLRNRCKSIAAYGCGRKFLFGAL